MSEPSKLSVLVLEDDNLPTRLELAGFKKVGVNGKLAQSPEAAIRDLLFHPVDVVVVNLDSNSFDPLLACRHLSERFPVPICATTVRNDVRLTETARMAGAGTVVSQPLPSSEFIERLKDLAKIRIRNADRSTPEGLLVEVQLHNQKWNLSVRNISTSGAFIEFKSEYGKIENEAILNLNLFCNTLKLNAHIRAKIVRVAHNGFGVEFRLIDGKTKETINELVEFHQQSIANFYK